MSEGNMTGRPYGGANEKPDGGPLPGEREEEDEVGAAPAQSPRAADGPMSGDVTRTPGGGGSTKPAGVPDATGPQG